MDTPRLRADEHTVDVRLGTFTLEAALGVPRHAAGLVILVGAGDQPSQPYRLLATAFRQGGLGTLLLNLLTPAEAAAARRSLDQQPDPAFLAERLQNAADWAASHADTRRLGRGYFGGGPAAPAALVAAARRPDQVRAIVTSGSRPDLAGDVLPHVQAPTLMLVGDQDLPTLGLHQFAFEQLTSEKRIDVLPGVSHVLEASGGLDIAARRAREWFLAHLQPPVG